VVVVGLSALPVSGGSVSTQGNCRKHQQIDVCGRFLEEWSKQGSEQNNVYVNGLPITARRAEISTTDGKTYDTQWFERARYEAHLRTRGLTMCYSDCWAFRSLRAARLAGPARVASAIPLMCRSRH
jgi:hypothetical protein